MRPLLRFVETPTEASVVRLDINDVGATVDVRTLHDGFSLGMPELGGQPGRQGRKLGLRTLALPMAVEGPRTAALAAHRALAREAMRDGWIQWQLDASTKPVWFRVYASTPEPVSFERVRRDRDRDSWGFKLSLQADGPGVGEVVTLGPFTVTNSPLAGAHAMQVALPEIEGDVPAQANVRVAKAGWSAAPAVGSMPTPMASFAATTWANVTGPTADSAFLDPAGYRTFTQPPVAGYVTTATFDPTGLAPGRYSTMLRLRGSATGSRFLARWKVLSEGATSSIYSEPFPIASTPNLRWVNGGDIPWPLIDGGSLGIPAESRLQLSIWQLSGTDSLRLDDCVLLTPAAVGRSTGTMLRMRADTPKAGTTEFNLLVSGDERRTVLSSTAAIQRPPTTEGVWPILRPGEANHIFLAQTIAPADLSFNDDKASTAQVTVTYRPRFLWGVG